MSDQSANVANAAQGPLRATVNRREMLRTLSFATAGVALGCAGVTPRSVSAPVSRRHFARVRVSRDRVIRELAGLRPFRPSGFVVRAESIGDRTVVHNYGHGGGGISLSWGSSMLAAELATATGQTRFAVLGAGVMGLTTARLLQDRGFEATIYTRDLSPNTTSNIAGGQWSPYTVSDAGAVTPAYQLQFERAARYAHRYYQHLVGPTYGVRWIEQYVLRFQPFPQAAADPIADLYFENEILSPGDHPFAFPYARRFTTMLVEPAVFLSAVTRDYLLRGGRIHVREFHERDEIRSLPEQVVVNCTGLGSAALFGDAELTPIKGQLVILLPQADVDYIMTQGEFYMFPRSDGIVLGGTRGRGDGSVSIDVAASARILDGHRAVFEGMNAESAR